MSTSTDDYRAVGLLDEVGDTSRELEAATTGGGQVSRHPSLAGAPGGGGARLSR